MQVLYRLGCTACSQQTNPNSLLLALQSRHINHKPILHFIFQHPLTSLINRLHVNDIHVVHNVIIILNIEHFLGCRYCQSLSPPPESAALTPARHEYLPSAPAFHLAATGFDTDLRHATPVRSSRKSKLWRCARIASLSFDSRTAEGTQASDIRALFYLFSFFINCVPQQGGLN